MSPIRKKINSKWEDFAPEEAFVLEEIPLWFRVHADISLIISTLLARVVLGSKSNNLLAEHQCVSS